MAIVANRAFEMSTPQAMDVGCVEEDLTADGGQDELEVDAISGKCYNFDGWGHAASECPSPPNTQGQREG